MKIKKIGKWLAGLALVSLPIIGVSKPELIPYMPIAKEILTEIVADNETR